MANPKYETVAPGEVKQIVPDRKARRFEVIKARGGGEVWFTHDGSDPVIGGNGVEVIPGEAGALEVELRTAATPTFRFRATATALVGVKEL